MRGVLRAELLASAVAGMPDCIRLAPDPSGITDLLHDESRTTAKSIASAAAPVTLDELRQVMGWHAAQGNVVSVSGARTGVTGGAVPDEASHVVSIAGLRGVLSIDAESDPPEVRVLAGTTLRELQEALATRAPHLSLPLDPTETSASLGGMVSTNAGGARTFRFGATRDWVLGLTVELASGNTLTLRRGRDQAAGREVVLVDASRHSGTSERHLTLDTIPKPRTKSAIGYGFVPDGDVLDLFVGAEGTLGVVSTVTLRLQRTAEHRLAFLQCFASVPQAFAFVNALRGDHALRTTAIEFLDATSHALARETGKPEVERVLAVAPEGSCSVFAEFGYDDDAALDECIERVGAHVAACDGAEAHGLAGIDEQTLRDIKVFRHAVPERINATIARRREQHPTLHKIATDMAVEDADLTWVYDLFTTTLHGAGLDFAVFGHAGNNHFHVNILPRDENELVRAKALYMGLASAVVARGGCVAAEHGIGRIKKNFLTVQYSPEQLAAFRRIKRWADPEWRLNRGVLIDPE